MLCALGKSIEVVKKYQDYDGERKEWAEWTMGCVRGLVNEYRDAHCGGGGLGERCGG